MRYLILISLFFVFISSAEASQPLAFGQEPEVGKAYSVYAKATNNKTKWGVSELGSRVAMGQLPLGTRILLMYQHKSIISIVSRGDNACCKYQLGLSRSIMREFGMKDAWKGRIRMIVLSGGMVGPTATYEDPEDIPIILY